MERIDGTGYPNGLCGDTLSPAALLVGLADVLDGILENENGTTTRQADKAIQYVKKSGPSRFGSDAAACFEQCREKILEMYVG